MASSLTDDNYIELIMAIVKQAADDYIVALKADRPDMRTIREVERFICNSELVSFTKLDGERLIADLKAMCA